MAKLLLVDDDSELLAGLARNLTGEGYVVETAGSGGDALQLLSAFPFEVVVLDWQLGDMTGLEVLRSFRQSGGTTPVLMLTGMSDLDSKESGLDAGADDYLTKPFETRELCARLRSILRRPSILTSSKLAAKGISLEVETRIISDGNQTVRLSQREAALLEFLLRHQNRHFSSSVIRETVWPLDSEGSDDTVRTCMRTLRQKLTKINRADLIKTDLKNGYIIES